MSNKPDADFLLADLAKLNAGIGLAQGDESQQENVQPPHVSTNDADESFLLADLAKLNAGIGSKQVLAAAELAIGEHAPQKSTSAAHSAAERWTAHLRQLIQSSHTKAQTQGEQAPPRTASDQNIIAHQEEQAWAERPVAQEAPESLQQIQELVTWHDKEIAELRNVIARLNDEVVALQLRLDESGPVNASADTQPTSQAPEDQEKAAEIARLEKELRKLLSDIEIETHRYESVRPMIDTQAERGWQQQFASYQKQKAALESQLAALKNAR